MDDLITLLSTTEFREAMAAFVESRKNPNFKFWWSYMQMVEILLLFTRAQRDGLWRFLWQSFTSMLPYFFRYNHINYARWGTVYISEMHNLPAEVEAEFEQLCGKAVRAPVQPGISRSEPRVAEWNWEEGRWDCWHNKNNISSEQVGSVLQSQITSRQ